MDLCWRKGLYRWWRNYMYFTNLVCCYSWVGLDVFFRWSMFVTNAKTTATHAPSPPAAQSLPSLNIHYLMFFLFRLAWILHFTTFFSFASYVSYLFKLIVYFSIEDTVFLCTYTSECAITIRSNLTILLLFRVQFFFVSARKIIGI